MEYQQRVLFSRESKKRGMLLDKLCVVNDLKGLGSHHLTRLTLGTLKKFSRIDQDCYPECLGKLFIINAPWIFATAWSLIKTFLDKNVQDKIHILSGSAEKQAQVLIREVGADFFAYDAERREIKCLKPISDAQGGISPLQQEFNEHYGMGRK